MRKVVAVVLFVAIAVMAGCGRSGDSSSSETTGGRILIAAAADLRFAFEEMKPLFAQECGCEVEISFGSSGNFATQIEQGLPADVFFSANVSFIEGLQLKGLTLEGTEQLYAVGRIVLAKNKTVPISVESLRDLLNPSITKVSIANPQHAPYGVAAREAITKTGIWNDIQAKLVLGENASQATQFVQTGDAPAGIIPLSLAISLQDKISYVLIDESQHNRLSQGSAVLRRSQNREVAKRFIEFVNGTKGREIMAKYGFQPPS